MAGAWQERGDDHVHAAARCMHSTVSKYRCESSAYIRDPTFTLAPHTYADEAIDRRDVYIMKIDTRTIRGSRIIATW